MFNDLLASDQSVRLDYMNIKEITANQHCATISFFLMKFMYYDKIHFGLAIVSNTFIHLSSNLHFPWGHFSSYG